MQTTKQTYKRQGQWVAWCQPSLFDGPILFTREAGLEPLQPLNSLLQRRNVTSVLASALDSGRCRGKLAARNAPSSWERCQCLHTSRWLVETAIQTVRWRSKGQLRKMAFCFSGSRIVRKVWNSSCHSKGQSCTGRYFRLLALERWESCDPSVALSLVGESISQGSPKSRRRFASPFASSETSIPLPWRGAGVGGGGGGGRSKQSGGSANGDGDKPSWTSSTAGAGNGSCCGFASTTGDGGKQTETSSTAGAGNSSCCGAASTNGNGGKQRGTSSLAGAGNSSCCGPASMCRVGA